MADSKEEKAAKKLLAGKYETAEELEHAYAEANKLLSRHGEELGGLRGQLQQWQQVWQQAQPVVQWYEQNQQHLPRYNAWMQAQSQQPQAAAQPQAAQAVAGLLGLLTPQERQSLIQETAQHLTQGALGPWTQNFARTMQQYAQQAEKRVTDSAAQQARATTQVLNKMIEMIAPEDRMAAVRAYQEEALRLAQSPLDPMQLAEERLSMTGRLSTSEARVKELEAEREKREKAMVPSLGASTSPGINTTLPGGDRPKTREDRFAAVMRDTTNAVGAEAMADAFPGALGR